MKFGVIGSGSWATALVKILTDNNNCIYWWIRNSGTIAHIQQRKHNPHYLHSVYFSSQLLQMSSSIDYVVENADVLVIAVPSAYVTDALNSLHAEMFAGKKVVSAVKGILPDGNELINDYLKNTFNFDMQNYVTLLGPCHAEEVAAEKLSYLTFSGTDETLVKQIAKHFTTDYLQTKTNADVVGVQYAAVLKNVYALGAGIAHGLEYGDNFLSVYIANCAREMVGFLRKLIANHTLPEIKDEINYASSVYLGDLLVTCYSLHSRNRMFGTMIGKGYSVKAAQLELNMVAEGYNASKCIYHKNEKVEADMPILNIIYKILWKNLEPAEGFKRIETLLI